jgi:hypothetical protein
MAVVPYTVGIPIDAVGSNIPRALIVTWGPMANGDTGKPFVTPNRTDKSVQVRGTFGAGGNARIEGSNDQAYDTAGATASPAPTFTTLNDPQGNVLDITAAKMEEILENPNAIRPNITAGDGTTALTVVLLASSVMKQ